MRIAVHSLHNDRPIIMFCSVTQKACPSTLSSLALPSGEFFHLLPNCSTISWIHQAHYFLEFPLKALHHCVLYSPQLILHSLYTCTPWSQRRSFSSPPGSSERGRVLGKRRRWWEAGESVGVFGIVTMKARSPPQVSVFRVFYLLRRSHTNTDMGHTSQKT